MQGENLIDLTFTLCGPCSRCFTDLATFNLHSNSTSSFHHLHFRGKGDSAEVVNTVLVTVLVAESRCELRPV